MKSKFISAPQSGSDIAKKRVIEGWAKKILLNKLDGFSRGRLKLVDGDHEMNFGQTSDDFPIEAVIKIHSPSFYNDLLFGGSIGAAESYIRGCWTSEDIAKVVRIVILNMEMLEDMDSGWSRIKEPLHKLFHFLRKNTRSGSRANIVAHYDLGNEFYALFLDETMTYSNGIWENDDSTLAEASIAKYDRICRKLSLSPNDHVMEIGGGWGGFAVYAARKYGCRVTTTTISDEQYTYMKDLIKREELEDEVEIIKKDYREISGKYEKLVSIEMIEAVGHHYLDVFFQCCGKLLKPNGLMALQAITIPDDIYEKHKKSVDFIKRYIFPGSCIPSVAAMADSVRKYSDMRLVHFEDITPHYVKTLRSWRERFFSNIDRVRKMGFSEEFIRMWEFYLCYCEGSFEERYNGDVQMIFAKPLSKREPILGRI